MTTSIGFLLAGVGGGAVVAALALGLVLTHQSSGFVNFAHAATGMYVALAYFEFRETGDLVLPILGLPERVHLVPHPTLATALAVAVLLACALGALGYGLVVRPLRSAPPLARVVASLGLLLYFQETARLRFPVSGSSVVRRRPVLPATPVHVLGTTVTANRVVLAGLVVTVTVVLVVVFRWSRFGLATRAAAHEERGALLMGISPHRVGVVNWMAATALGGLAVVLIEPISGISTATTPLLVVPALAAALLGRFESFGVTTATALGLGMVQSLVLGWAVRPGATWVPSWLPTTGVQQAIPLLLIVVVLAVRGDAIPGRATAFTTRRPPAPRPRLVMVTTAAVAGIALAALWLGDATVRHGVIVSSIATLTSLSVVVVTGYTGQISLAPLALAGIAGFTSLHLIDAGVPFLLVLAAGALVAAAVGVAVAWPATRVRGMSLGVATLAVAVAIEQLVLASTPFSGGVGGARVPRPTIFGWDVGISARGAGNFRPQFGAVCVVVVAACAGAVANARRNPTGLRWLAVRANERAAAAAGVDVARAKLGAFATSSALAGLAGVLTAFSVTTLSPTSFMVIGSLVAVALTYLAGIASVGGAVLAGLLAQGGFLTALTSGDSAGNGSTLAWSGLALVVAAIAAPAGITGLVSRALARLGAGRSHTDAPASADLTAVDPA